MAEKVFQIAEQVIRRADREHPADAVLRAELRGQHGLTRDEGWKISTSVFAYYRWLGWLNPAETLVRQIQHALELNQRFREHPNRISDADLRRTIPNWAARCMDVSPEWLRELQQEPALWLRARPGGGSELARRLRDCKPAGDGPLSDALHYTGVEDLFRTPEFHAGKFELQDLSSQIVSLVCAPRAGETWWDACAGEGGKLLHLCDLMNNKGLVWASDRAAWRLQRLKRRTARAGLFNYRATLWPDESKPPTKTKFDGVLVDAPCSGLGTWQRNPHARWTMRFEDVVELAQVQQRLLATAAASLKPKGRLIYSVCTMTRAETLEVASAITTRFPELEPLPFVNPLSPAAPSDSHLILRPELVRANGMFIAAWRRK